MQVKCLAQGSTGKESGQLMDRLPWTLGLWPHDCPSLYPLVGLKFLLGPSQGPSQTRNWTDLS